MIGARTLGHAVEGLIPRRVTREGVVLEQHLREGRFQRALALVAGLASLMSGYQVTTEHYRAGYGLQVMYVPVLATPLLIVAGVWSVFSRQVARTLLPVASLLTIGIGFAGFYYHVRNIARRPGGWRLPVVNIVMGPPLFAPILFGLSGYLGLIASLLRRSDGSGGAVLPPAWLRRLPSGIEHETVTFEQDVREGRFQQHIAAVAGLTGLLAGAEALYSHYVNEFEYRAEWTPVLLGPIMAVAGLGTVGNRTIARTLLPLASILSVLDGTLGFYYHVRGVLRRPGGPKLSLYNVLYGPPIFAPLLVAAGGFMGLIASLLRRAEG